VVLPLHEIIRKQGRLTWRQGFFVVRRFLRLAPTSNRTASASSLPCESGSSAGDCGQNSAAPRGGGANWLGSGIAPRVSAGCSRNPPDLAVISVGAARPPLVWRGMGRRSAEPGAVTWRSDRDGITAGAAGMRKNLGS
jgi:hypothetical protein